MGSDHYPLSQAAWNPAIEFINRLLPDEKVLGDVSGFLAEPGETPLLPAARVPGVQLYLDEKSLVISHRIKEGFVLYAKVLVDPIFTGSTFTGRSRGGELKVMYDGEGNWLDEFYRSNER